MWREGKVDYLKLAKDMGANVVRTWGIDQGNAQYLKKANQYGLYVNAGIWLNPVYADGRCSYIMDVEYKKEVRRQTLEYVKRNMNDPAVLFWNVGNETIYWTNKEEERVFFCLFLERLIQEVHALDPHHPVIYTSSYATAVPYIKKYVPSLNILGINAYGGFESLHQV